jgi:long-chain acyl-CoA synthetase
VFVFGIPAGNRGEDVAAIVAVAPGASITQSDIVAYGRSQLSSYKVPKHIRIVEEGNLPLLPTGKADLAAMRTMFVAEA